MQVTVTVKTCIDNKQIEKSASIYMGDSSMPIPCTEDVRQERIAATVYSLLNILFPPTDEKKSEGKKYANLALINRSTKNGFVAYMMANPVYFQQQFERPATPENIVSGYKEAMRLRKQLPAFPKHLDDNDTGIVYHTRK